MAPLEIRHRSVRPISAKHAQASRFLQQSPLVYVFGHGQFIQAAHAIVADAHLDDRGKMLGFWRKGEPPAIGNAQRVGFQWRGGPLGMCAAGRRLEQHPLYRSEEPTSELQSLMRHSFSVF